MKRVLGVFGGLSFVALLGVSLLWYWLTPHKSGLVRRAEKRDVQAMYDVGIAHLSVSGKGLIDPKSDRDPVYWFRLAATNGHSGAMYVLADLGIPNEEKVMWLKKGAELGNGACVTELIKGYTHGVYGLPRNPVEAFHWVKIGWRMDFKERQYDTERQSKEMTRLLANYRSNLRVTLQQDHLPKEEVERILAQIQ